MNGDSTSLPSSCSSRGAEESQPHLPVIHLVSRRARQFETGEEEDSTDRTSFYRSELARLSSKKGVPEVAARKREYESRNLQDNSNARKLEKGMETTCWLKTNSVFFHCVLSVYFIETFLLLISSWKSTII